MTHHTHGVPVWLYSDDDCSAEYEIHFHSKVESNGNGWLRRAVEQYAFSPRSFCSIFYTVRDTICAMLFTMCDESVCLAVAINRMKTERFSDKGRRTPNEITSASQCVCAYVWSGSSISSTFPRAHSLNLIHAVGLFPVPSLLHLFHSNTHTHTHFMT